MSRIKILLLVVLILIIAALGIIFIQNQQLITLKLLCPADSQPCLYQTPPFPLATWIALATLAGMISNLVIQTLNRYGYNNSRRQKTTINNSDLYPENRSSKSQNDRQSSYQKNIELQDSVQDAMPGVNSYETRQEPENIRRSGSNYSYKYRNTSDRSQQDRDSNQKHSSESDVDANSSSDSDDEDWI